MRPPPLSDGIADRADDDLCFVHNHLRDCMAFYFSDEAAGIDKLPGDSYFLDLRVKSTTRPAARRDIS